MRLKETDKERDHHRDGEAREMVEIMTRGTEDQITETNDQVATENFIQQVETGENPEPDLELILSLLGTWASNKIPTAKRGSEYCRERQNQLAPMGVLHH